jgi:hypothetical protein
VHEYAGATHLQNQRRATNGAGASSPTMSRHSMPLVERRTFSFLRLLLLGLFLAQEGVAILVDRVTVADRVKEQALFQWIEEHGGKVSGLKIQTPSDGGPRGVFTTVKVPNNTLVFYIPHTVVIHKGMILNEALNPDFNRFFNPLKDSFRGDDCVLMGLYIMFERFYNPQVSFIKPYLDLLPQDVGAYSFLPKFWDNDLRELFRTLPSGFRVYFLKQQAFEQIPEFLRNDILTPLQRYVATYHQRNILAEELMGRFAWASAAVQTRAWHGLSRKYFVGDTTNIPSGNCTMVPLADMLNHRSNAGALVAVTKVFEDGSKRTFAHGIQNILGDIPAGGEIYDSYAGDDKELCNIDHLLVFGFVDPHPMVDCFKFSVTIDFGTGSNFPEEKKKLLESLGLLLPDSKEIWFVLRGSTAEVSRVNTRLLLFMRIWSISTTFELDLAKEIIEKFTREELDYAVWSLNHERKSIQKLRENLAVLKSSAFQSSIEDDLRVEREIDEALDTNAADTDHEYLHRKKMILEIGRREKMVLEVYWETLNKHWLGLLEENASRPRANDIAFECVAGQECLV